MPLVLAHISELYLHELVPTLTCDGKNFSACLFFSPLKKEMSISPAWGVTALETLPYLVSLFAANK